MRTFNSLSNKEKGKYYTDNYTHWRNICKYNKNGFFIIFNDFEEKNILKKISGNALKLYVFLGIHSKNSTGESWYTIESISQYFKKTPRSVSKWFNELEKLNLIRRIQLEYNGASHTFLQPY